MRILPPPKPTVFQAALGAPVVTPIVAIVALGFFPDIFTTGGYYILALPFIFFLSLIFGYIGMLFICLPIAFLLSVANRLNAVTLCALTSTIGAAAWTWFRLDPMQELINSAAVGFLCSLGVSVVFCFISGITIRSSRVRFAASALAL